MGKIKMSAGLLDLIIMVQAYKKLIICEGIFNETHKTGEKKDWYKETEKYYHNIDNDILKEYGLSKNIISYERVIGYKVTEEMMSTLFEDLSKFEF